MIHQQPTVRLERIDPISPYGVDAIPYASFLGLKAAPFPVTPDETHYFFTAHNEAVFAELRHFVALRKGFMVLTGEVGLGKTTLIRRLMASWDSELVHSALVLSSFLGQKDLLRAVVTDFGLSEDHSMSALDLLRLLNNHLLSSAAAGKTCVLIIDDAQALDVGALDLLRQLSNLETSNAKLLQIILCGQPELLDKLQSNDLRQVLSRMALARHLEPFSAHQTRAYVLHRLKACGLSDPDFVESAALAEVHLRTSGNPRSIHHLLDRALYALSIEKASRLTSAHVQLAWDDLQDRGRPAGSDPVETPPESRRRNAWRYLPGAMALIVSFAATAVWLRDGWSSGSQALVEHEKPSARPVTPVPPTLSSPPGWADFVGRFDGLSTLAWPRVQDMQGLVPALERVLTVHDPLERWSVLVLSAGEATACKTYPVLPLGTGASTEDSKVLTFISSTLPHTSVSMGTQSFAVEAMQIVLSQGNWLPDALVDGVMGPKTALALSRFQAARGLHASGQADGPTAFALSCAMQTDDKSPFYAAAEGKKS